MTAVRRCLSLSPELNGALLALGATRSESVSALVETLLREHALVRKSIELGRLEAALPDGPWAFPGPGPLREILKEAAAKASSSGAKPPNRVRRKAGLTP